MASKTKRNTRTSRPAAGRARSYALKAKPSTAKAKLAPSKAEPREPMPGAAASGATETAAGEQNVLVLQGGGALGAYQAGVYEMLAASGHLPGWVAGISIGAINAALIVGNPPERRLNSSLLTGLCDMVLPSDAPDMRRHMLAYP